MSEADGYLQSQMFKKSIEQAWREFDKENPQVYRVLVRLALEVYDRGIERIGIGLLWERMRWEMMMQATDPSSEFKLNNNYRALYARKIMKEHPQLEGLFATRKRRAP